MSEKVLRIGVIQGKKVVEERRLKRRIPVTVGTDAKNTFSADGKGMPNSWGLFELKGGKYELIISKEMKGYVHIGDEKVPLSDLRDRGEAKPQGDRFRLPLDELGGGRVQIGEDVSILFHFMAPQVAAAPASLPVGMKSGVLATLEPYFTGVLAVSFILHALFTLVISFSERSLEPPSREDVLKYMAQVQPQKIEVKVPEAKVEEKEDENEDKEGKDDKPKKAKKKEEPKKTADKSAGKPKKGKGTSDAKRAEIREKVAGQALAAIIGATGGGAGSAVGDIFKSGTSIGGDLTEAIAGTDGVGVASGGGDVTRRGSGDGNGGSAAGIEGGLGTTGGGAVGGTSSKAKVRKKISGSARVRDIASVDGTVDKRGVAKALKRRGAAFRQCYENALKSNSKLKGKLVMEFTINKRGKVSDTDVIKDSLGSTAVSRCVAGVLKRIRFPKPEDGEVTIRNSFVFTPNG